MIPMQSLVPLLLNYYDALFKDIAPLYSSRSDLERDLSRLKHELVARGLRVATLDLPASAKHFLRCLDQGAYTPSGDYLSSFGRHRVPAFLQNLMLRIFDSGGKLREVPCVSAIQAIRTLMEGAKKIPLPAPERTYRNEVKNFKAVERDMRLPSLDWDSGSISHDYDYQRLQFQTALADDHNAGDLFGQEPLQHSVGGRLNAVLSLTTHQVCDIVSSTLGVIHNDTELPRHGPGVTANQKRTDDKFAFNEWPSTLDALYPADLYAVPSMDHVQSLYSSGRLKDHKVPSRLIAVPKTMSGPRLIAAEPTCNQWIQQLLMKQLLVALERTPIRHSITLRDQRQNGELARRGSATGSHTTVDLSSASDRLSCWTVERVFRRNSDLLARLAACRTTYMRISDRTGTEHIRLRKFGTMGSAVTFPVQTIVYTCLAIASVLCGQRVTIASVERASRQVSVYGDDIVIPSHAMGNLTALLDHVGLLINHSKTYGTGRFRESCGQEWYDGHDVTIPRLTIVPRGSSTLLTTQALQVRNNYYGKGYWNVAYWLASQYTGLSRVPSCDVGSDKPSLYSFVRGRNTQKWRWNSQLHRLEAYELRATSTASYEGRDGLSVLFRWFIEEPAPDIHWMADRAMETKSKWTSGWVPADPNSLSAVWRLPGREASLTV